MQVATFSPRQVTVIGHARLRDAAQAALCRDLGRALADAGYSLICGGLGGVMLETCRGFKEVQNPEGVTVGILPDYDFASANPYVDLVIPTGLDLGRNQLVVASGRAVIVIGGGAGTLSEIALASQINKPIILLKGSGGWADRLDLDYLDERRNAPLYHASDCHEVLAILRASVHTPSRAGAIDSGHNR